jgi:hypothetical protein
MHPTGASAAWVFAAAPGKVHRLVPVLATRSFLIDVHVLGSRDYPQASRG